MKVDSSPLSHRGKPQGLPAAQQADSFTHSFSVFSFQRTEATAVSWALLNFIGPQCTGQQCSTYYSTEGESVSESCVYVQIQEMQARA